MSRAHDIIHRWLQVLAFSLFVYFVSVYCDNDFDFYSFCAFFRLFSTWPFVFCNSCGYIANAIIFILLFLFSSFRVFIWWVLYACVYVYTGEVNEKSLHISPSRSSCNNNKSIFAYSKKNYMNKNNTNKISIRNAVFLVSLEEAFLIWYEIKITLALLWK